MLQRMKALRYGIALLAIVVSAFVLVRVQSDPTHEFINARRMRVLTPILFEIRQALTDAGLMPGGHTIRVTDLGGAATAAPIEMIEGVIGPRIGGSSASFTITTHYHGQTIEPISVGFALHYDLGAFAEGSSLPTPSGSTTAQRVVLDLLRDPSIRTAQVAGFELTLSDIRDGERDVIFTTPYPFPRASKASSARRTGSERLCLSLLPRLFDMTAREVFEDAQLAVPGFGVYGTENASGVRVGQCHGLALVSGMEVVATGYFWYKPGAQGDEVTFHLESKQPMAQFLLPAYRKDKFEVGPSYWLKSPLICSIGEGHTINKDMAYTLDGAFGPE